MTIGKMYDRVKETTTSTASPFILGGAQTGYQAFSTRLSNNDEVYVTIAVGSSWQTCRARYTTAANSLTVLQIYESSNANNAVTFPSGAKDIWLDSPAIASEPVVWDMVRDFGARGNATWNGSTYTGTDNTAAFQAMLDAAGARRGTIRVFVPDGMYLISGPCGGVNNQNAQLRMPTVPYTSQPLSLEIFGTGQNVNNVYPAGQVAPTGGAIIASNATNPQAGARVGSILGGGNDGSLPGSIVASWITLKLKGLEFRTYPNPNLSALDLQWVGNMDIDLVTLSTGQYDLNTITQPTHTDSYGLYGPGNNSGGAHRLGQLLTLGYYNGLSLCENVTFEYIFCEANMVGLELRGGWHNIVGLKMTEGWCVDGIKVPTNAQHCRFSCLSYDIERANTGWAAAAGTTGYSINDPSSLSRGILWWSLTIAGTGYSHDFRKNGALYIQTNEIGQ